MSFYVIDIEFTLKELKLSFSMKGVDLVMILMLFISTGGELLDNKLSSFLLQPSLRRLSY
jgi:hypothetical protein